MKLEIATSTLTLLLSLALSLPDPAWGLRQAGLEESAKREELARALLDHQPEPIGRLGPAAIRGEFPGGLISGSSGSPAAGLPVDSEEVLDPARAGLEEGGERGTGQQIVQLLSDLRDPKGSVRRFSVQNLGRLGPQAAAAVSELSQILVEPGFEGDSSVRTAVPTALKRIGSPALDAIPALLYALVHDKAQTVRMAADSALRSFSAEFPGAKEYFVRALEDGDAGIRGAAALYPTKQEEDSGDLLERREASRKHLGLRRAASQPVSHSRRPKRTVASQAQPLGTRYQVVDDHLFPVLDEGEEVSHEIAVSGVEDVLLTVRIDGQTHAAFIPLASRNAKLGPDVVRGLVLPDDPQFWRTGTAIQLPLGDVTPPRNKPLARVSVHFPEADTQHRDMPTVGPSIVLTRSQEGLLAVETRGPQHSFRLWKLKALSPEPDSGSSTGSATVPAARSPTGLEEEVKHAYTAGPEHSLGILAILAGAFETVASRVRQIWDADEHRLLGALSLALELKAGDATERIPFTPGAEDEEPLRERLSSALVSLGLDMQSPQKQWFLAIPAGFSGPENNVALFRVDLIRYDPEQLSRNVPPPAAGLNAAGYLERILSLYRHLMLDQGEGNLLFGVRMGEDAVALMFEREYAMSELSDPKKWRAVVDGWLQDRIADNWFLSRPADQVLRPVATRFDAQHGTREVLLEVTLKGARRGIKTILIASRSGEERELWKEAARKGTGATKILEASNLREAGKILRGRARKDRPPDAVVLSRDFAQPTSLRSFLEATVNPSERLVDIPVALHLYAGNRMERSALRELGVVESIVTEPGERAELQQVRIALQGLNRAVRLQHGRWERIRPDVEALRARYQAFQERLENIMRKLEQFDSAGFGIDELLSLGQGVLPPPNDSTGADRVAAVRAGAPGLRRLFDRSSRVSISVEGELHALDQPDEPKARSEGVLNVVRKILSSLRETNEGMAQWLERTAAGLEELDSNAFAAPEIETALAAQGVALLPGKRLLVSPAQPPQAFSRAFFQSGLEAPEGLSRWAAVIPVKAGSVSEAIDFFKGQGVNTRDILFFNATLFSKEQITASTPMVYPPPGVLGLPEGFQLTPEEAALLGAFSRQFGPIYIIEAVRFITGSGQTRLLIQAA